MVRKSTTIPRDGCFYGVSGGAVAKVPHNDSVPQARWSRLSLPKEVFRHRPEWFMMTLYREHDSLFYPFQVAGAI